MRYLLVALLIFPLCLYAIPSGSKRSAIVKFMPMRDKNYKNLSDEEMKVREELYHQKEEVRSMKVYSPTKTYNDTFQGKSSGKKYGSKKKKQDDFYNDFYSTDFVTDEDSDDSGGSGNVWGY